LNFQPARGFVLSSLPYAEADKIAQLYTLQLGRVQALVKGARKPKSKLASALDLFNESGFSLHKGRSGNLFILSQAKVFHSYSELKQDLPGITTLQVLADILIHSFHDSEPQTEVYSLIKETLEALQFKQGQPELFLTAFTVKLIDLMGHPLELTVCAECGTSLQHKKVHLVPHRGGALCEDCCPSGPATLKVLPAEIEVLKKIRTLPMKKIHILKLKESSLRKIFRTVLEYLERTIEKKLKTIEYYLKLIPGPQ
jgi:DNA repair protein RecO (recombination protein O)